MRGFILTACQIRRLGLSLGTLRNWNIATCVVSPMDKHGYFSMGCSVDYTYSEQS